MVKQEQLKRYETSLTELRKKLIRTLGLDAVDLVMRRAIFEVSSTYPALSLIRCEDESVFFEGTDKAFANSTDEEAAAAFEALNGVMLLVIARILGREIATRLAEGVATQQLLKGIERERR